MKVEDEIKKVKREFSRLEKMNDDLSREIYKLHLITALNRLLMPNVILNIGCPIKSDGYR